MHRHFSGQRINGQTAVDGHRQIIWATPLTVCGSDAKLPGKLAAVVRNTGIKAGRTSP